MSETYHHTPTLASRTGPGWALFHASYQQTLAEVAALGGADLIATSPPYCDCRTYGAAVSWGDADYAALGDAVFAALKPGGHALVNVDAPVRDWTKDGRGTERGLHPWRLMLDWHDRIGFRVPDRLAFGRNGMPGRPPGRFRNDWEPLLWFQKPGAPGWFDADSISEQTAPRSRMTLRQADGVVKSDTSARLNYERVLPGTLWHYGNAGFGCTGAPDIEDQNHPARWPYRLAEDLVRCFCPPDGLVCDPFTGAGTTAAASIAWGRRFIGGDLYARQEDGKPWIDVAGDVLVQRQRQKKLF